MSQQGDASKAEDLSRRIRQAIIDVPDFPKPGIVFKDLTPIFRDIDLFAALVKGFSQRLPPAANKLAAIDARGFLIAAPVAIELHLPLVACRKPGKLPGEILTVSYELEYGSNSLCITSDAVQPGDRVFIVDDLLATGGTARASSSLCRKAGASVLGYGFIVELGFLNGRRLLDDADVFSFVNYP
jgi:adenine phosphoribosyltransferase